MVLLVDEVNLGIQLLDNLFVILLDILHRQFFIVLTTLVKLAQSQNFSVADFYTFFELSDSLLQSLVGFLKIIAPLSDFVGSFVSAP